MGGIRKPGCLGFAALALTAVSSTALAAEPIRISFGNAAPLEYSDAQGKPQGFTVDVLREAAKRAGIAVTWQPGGTPEANNEAFRRGTLDLIAAGSTSPERRKDFYVSEPWWWGEMIAITRAESPLHSDTEFRKLSLATTAAGSFTVIPTYPGNSFITAPNARGAVAKVCSGEAEAALIENMYLREMLPGLGPVCRDVALRVFDISARREYHIIARPGIKAQAQALRSEIDDMTTDGTLALIAARRLPVSTPQATRVAELLRARQESELSRIRIGAAVFLVLFFLSFFLWQQRASARLLAVNVRLESAQRQLEAAIAQLETAFDSLNDAVLVFDLEGQIVYRNQAALRMGGIGGLAEGNGTVFELPSWSPAASPETGDSKQSAPPDLSPFRRVLNGEVLRSETFVLGVPPDERYVECSGSLVRGKSDQPLLAVTAIRDVTEARHAAEDRERLRAEVAQAQKMESVGRLAGGIAHDFNNLLTVINGYAELMAMNPLLPRTAKEQVRAISHAGETAAQLTGQLLAFSRKQPAKAQVLDLNEQISENAVLLGRMLGEDIRILTTLVPHPVLAAVDQTQLRQLLMNLAINARDAMPGGGKFWIELRDGTEAEPRIHLQIRDSGTGISDEVLDHIFEPFFTTKAPGTGLGLAIVYSAVKQWGGTISVSSRPGEGTTFDILLPRVEAPTPPAPEPELAPARGQETILLVEDQEHVRMLAKHILEEQQYRILEASGGEAALALERGFDGMIDLLLTDVVMPGMSGPELASRLSEIRPGMKVLYMSGYTDDVLGKRGMLEADVELIGKPFTALALAQRVRKLLGTVVAENVTGPGTHGSGRASNDAGPAD